MRGLSGWQTSLADLALILFVVVAGAHRGIAQDDTPGEAQVRTQVPASGQPMAVFRAVGDADLPRWLAAQDLDRGEIATVIVRHRPGSAAAAVREATGLVAQIEAAGREARVMIEPSADPETLVVVAHDRWIPDGTEIARTRD